MKIIIPSIFMNRMVSLMKGNIGKYAEKGIVIALGRCGEGQFMGFLSMVSVCTLPVVSHVLA
jgi:hypothetical protein